MKPDKSSFSLTSRGIECCVVTVGRHKKQRPERLAPLRSLKRTTTMQSKYHIISVLTIGNLDNYTSSSEVRNEDQ